MKLTFFAESEENDITEKQIELFYKLNHII